MLFFIKSIWLKFNVYRNCQSPGFWFIILFIIFNMFPLCIYFSLYFFQHYMDYFYNNTIVELSSIDKAPISNNKSLSEESISTNKSLSEVSSYTNKSLSEESSYTNKEILINVAKVAGLLLVGILAYKYGADCFNMAWDTIQHIQKISKYPPNGIPRVVYDGPLTEPFNTDEAIELDDIVVKGKPFVINIADPTPEKLREIDAAAQALYKAIADAKKE